MSFNHKLYPSSNQWRQILYQLFFVLASATRWFRGLRVTVSRQLLAIQKIDFDKHDNLQINVAIMKFIVISIIIDSLFYIYCWLVYQF